MVGTCHQKLHFSEELFASVGSKCVSAPHCQSFAIIVLLESNHWYQSHLALIEVNLESMGVVMEYSDGAGIRMNRDLSNPCPPRSVSLRLIELIPVQASPEQTVLLFPIISYLGLFWRYFQLEEAFLSTLWFSTVCQYLASI